MIDEIKKTSYKAFGLTITSEFLLSELLEANINEDSVDEITIKKVDLTLLWAEQSVQNRYFILKKDFCMFKVPGAAIYLIQNGNQILVSPLADSSEDEIRLYILGTCMGAILMQRKILPLHGSAIAIDGKAYAIVGDSGAGKSTLASAFLNKGYQLLSDDVIPITFSKTNIPMVVPAYPQQKLWLESLNEFGMEPEQYRPIFARETKFTVPISEQFWNKSLPLAGVIELVKASKDEINMRTIENMERFYTLFKHTYRNIFVNPTGLMEWHFDTSAKIINKAQVYQLERPISRFTANDLTDLILKKVTKEEKRDE